MSRLVKELKNRNLEFVIGDRRTESNGRRYSDNLEPEQVGSLEMAQLFIHYFSQYLTAIGGNLSLIEMDGGEGLDVLKNRVNKINRIFNFLRLKYTYDYSKSFGLEVEERRSPYTDRRQYDDVFEAKKFEGALKFHSRFSKAFQAHLDVFAQDIKVLEPNNQYFQIENALVKMYHLCCNPEDEIYRTPSKSAPHLTVDFVVSDSEPEFSSDLVRLN